MEDNNILTIQLGEASHKEVKEKPIPTGEKYSISKYGKPELDSIPIYVHQSTFLKIEDHIKTNVNIELGGVLLGELCKEKENHFLEILFSIPALHIKNSSTNVKFTHQTWEAIYNEFEIFKSKKELPDLSIVGWYHTHPGLGVFLSSYDVFIQKNFFNEVWQVALVIDPMQKERKFFRLIEDKIVACSGYYYLESPVKRLGYLDKRVDIKV
jgi:proteasome lid subunit RPN8/RPN11